MRRVWWVARVAVLVAATYCIFGSGGSFHRVRAADGGGGGGSCDTSTACSWSGQNCYCSSAGTGGSTCAGCFIWLTESGCGRCSAPPVLD